MCSWYLNWGRILLEDVTIMGVNFANSQENVTAAAPLIFETGGNGSEPEVSHCWESLSDLFLGQPRMQAGQYFKHF